MYNAVKRKGIGYDNVRTDKRAVYISPTGEKVNYRRREMSKRSRVFALHPWNTAHKNTPKSNCIPHSWVLFIWI